MDDQQGQNPFSGILERIKARKMQEQQASAPAPTQPMQGAEDVPNQLNRGDSGGNSHYLVSALQMLNKYITDETDPQNISIGRGLITLVTKLIAKEQQKLSEKLPQDEAMGGEGEHQMPDGSMMKNSEMSGME